MKRRIFLFGLLGLGLISALGGAYQWRARASTPPAAAGSAAAPGGAALPLELDADDVLTVRAAPLTETVAITGTLKAVEQTLVRAKVAGVLTELTVREGAEVQRGQRLGQIDPTEAQMRWQERTAALHSAQAQLDQSQRTLANTQRLHAQQFVAQSALDQAQAAVDVARGQRDAAAAQRALARTALNDTRLVAPIDGIVAERFVQAGEKLAVDSRIVSIINLSQLELEAPVAAAVVGRVQIGQNVDLQIEGSSDVRTARVVRIGPSTQAGTRLVPVYLALENRPPWLKAGLFARGRLPVSHRTDALTVPVTALREAAGEALVYVLDGAQLSERRVTLGVRQEAPDGVAMVEILSGLNAGETVVSKPLGGLPLDRPVVVHSAAGH